MTNFLQVAAQVIQSSNRCNIFTDQDDRLTFINAASLAWLDCSDPDFLLGTRFEDLDLDPVLFEMAEAARTDLTVADGLVEKETPIEHDGNTEMLLFRCMRVADDNGQNVGYAYTFNIQEASVRFAYDKIMINNLMRNSQDLIYFKDLESRFTRVNASMVEQLGANSIDDVIGKSDFDFWDSESATRFFEAEQDIIQSQQPIIAKTESGVHPNGDVAWSLTSKMPLFDEKGKVVGTFGISKDITVQKKFEAELAETHKELIKASRQAGMAEIASNILHNIGNVLNSINVSISQADDIARQLKIDNLQKVATMIAENADVSDYLVSDNKGKQIPEYLERLSSELANDQNEVIEELKSVKRHLEHVKQVVSMQQQYAMANQFVEKVDLAKVLEDAIHMSSGSLEQHRITLVREFETGMQVTIDKHRVLQILVNLIRNAKHAMQAADHNDKQLTITVQRSETDMVSIIISDNGIGIAPENLIKLFNHGFTTKANGNGFGLHSGANFAQQLGGSLIATSDGLGQGATFTLTFPLHAKPQTKYNSEAVANDAPATESIEA